MTHAARELGIGNLKMEHAIALGYYGILSGERHDEPEILSLLSERVRELIAQTSRSHSTRSHMMMLSSSLWSVVKWRLQSSSVRKQGAM